MVDVAKDQSVLDDTDFSNIWEGIDSLEEVNQVIAIIKSVIGMSGVDTSPRISPQKVADILAPIFGKDVISANRINGLYTRRIVIPEMEGVHKSYNAKDIARIVIYLGLMKKLGEDEYLVRRALTNPEYMTAYSEYIIELAKLYNIPPWTLGIQKVTVDEA
jgi:hypothetical protein